MRAFGLCKYYVLIHYYVTKALWYRRNMFKKYSGASQTLIFKLSLGTDNAFHLISTAILRNLEILGGTYWLKEFSIHPMCFEYPTNHFKMSKVSVKTRAQLRKDVEIEISLNFLNIMHSRDLFIIHSVLSHKCLQLSLVTWCVLCHLETERQQSTPTLPNPWAGQVQWQIS